MKQYIVPPTIIKGDVVDKLPHVKTWTERIRVYSYTNIPVAVFLVPEGTYIQMQFKGGELVGSAAAVDYLSVIDPGASVSTGIVEGFVTGEGYFLAVRLLSEDGTPASATWSENFNKLQQAGFSVVANGLVTHKGYYGLINRIVNWQGCDCRYLYSGVTCMIDDTNLEADLNDNPALPAPSVTYKYLEDTTVTEDVVEEQKPTHKLESVSFYGRLPQKHTVYEQLAKAAGVIVSDKADTVVVFDTSEIPAKFRGLENPPTLISVEEFTAYIEKHHAQEENSNKEDSD